MLRLASLGRNLRSQTLSRLYTSDAPAQGLTHRGRVFLGSLPKQTTRAEVEALFSKYNPSVVIVKDHTSLPPQTESISTPKASRSKIGFLWFSNEAQADAVIAAHTATPFALGKYNIVVKADSGASKKRPPGFQKLNMGMPRSKLASSTDTLYVSPLPHTVTDADLQAAFAPYGTVARVHIRQLPSQDTEWSFDSEGKRRVRKRQSPARATAFVQFADTASAAAAQEAAGFNWGRPGKQKDAGTEEGVVVAGMRVRANWALPKVDVIAKSR